MAANARRCRIAAEFAGQDRDSLPHGFWYAPSSWAPGVATGPGSADLERYLGTLDSLLLPWDTLVNYNSKDFQETPEMRIIRDLARDESITIKKADKGATIVVMNTTDYIAEVLSPRHLGNESVYSRCPATADVVLRQLCERVRTFTHNLFVDYPSLPEAFRPALQQATPKLGLFYLLPKIHKSGSFTHLPLGCPARPICAMTSHPCTPLA